MKKLSLLYITALAATFCFLYSSCKKTTHDTNPTPGNYRLLSYVKTSSATILLPLPRFVPTVVETYTFSYNSNNQVSKIIYTSNDSTKVNAGIANLIMTFSYSGTAITKTVTKPNEALVEIDSFMENSGGLITNAYTPTINNVFTYYGKLLVSNTEISHDSTTTLTSVSTYTSGSGNFRELTYDDDLAVSFTGLTGPITIYWTYFAATGAGTVITTTKTQSPVSQLTLSNYNREPVNVMAVDTLHDTAWGSYPGGIWVKQDFTFNGDYNRAGDYLQLQSFTDYGANLYQNNNLVSSIISSGYTTNITYTIDAQSKITQTSAAITDSLKNASSIVYNLQYTTY